MSVALLVNIFSAPFFLYKYATANYKPYTVYMTQRALLCISLCYTIICGEIKSNCNSADRGDFSCEEMPGRQNFWRADKGYIL
jgi:hypothetical protein